MTATFMFGPNFYATAGTFIETLLRPESESRKLFIVNKTCPKISNRQGRLFKYKTTAVAKLGTS